MNASFDERLEKYRLEDSVKAGCYEETPPRLRALMKTALAFSFHYWRDSSRLRTLTETDRRSGFAHQIFSQSAPWAFFFVDEEFRSPARLLAALSAAVLAGVDDCFVFFRNAADPLLVTALELAGIDQVFILSDSALETAPLWENTAEKGRVLFFLPGETSRAFEKLRASCPFPCRTESRRPRVFAADDREKDVLAAHPDALFTEPDAAEAVYGEFQAATPFFGEPFSRASTTLNIARSTVQNYGPGLEFCWIDLSPDFFHNTALRAAFRPEE